MSSTISRSAAGASLPSAKPVPPPVQVVPQVVLSFDVEEHFRIEAAAGLAIDADLESHCRERLAASTYWLLERLEARGARATFFIVGQVAKTNPDLIRAIERSGHEVASHGWDHRRVHGMTPAAFREDVRRSKDALEQVVGRPVEGYRAPTFSVVRQTAWAIDILLELGLRYDSSIFPIRHDRYGVPRSPRWPFLANGREGAILELPPATLRLWGINIPAGGGGYFRLLPLAVTEQAIRQQIARQEQLPVAMLYFHPWEFDPDQRRLPMKRLNRFRTYVGIDRSRSRLEHLLEQYRFVRAIDLVGQIEPHRTALPRFSLSA